MLRVVSSCLTAGVLAVSLCLTGCGGPRDPSTAANVTAPPAPAKALLEEVASSGQLGSGAETIRQALEGMKATDAAKAEELLKELAVLEKTTGAAKIKEKAKAMAAKL